MQLFLRTGLISYRLGEQLLKGGLDGVPSNPFKISIQPDPVPCFFAVIGNVVNPPRVEIRHDELALQRLQWEGASR